MFSIPQMVLVTLWFTFYNLLTSGTGLGLAAGGVVLNGLVVGAIMGDISGGCGPPVGIPQPLEGAICPQTGQIRQSQTSEKEIDPDHDP